METTNTSNSKRTPSRCREWERLRRNKFNDAIAKLGEIVKSINKSNNAKENTEDVQYAKVEIIQKAIICLTICIQEKTQLKAEILALQVKLDYEKNKGSNKKDASTQVYLGITRKRNKAGKYVRLLMLKNSKNIKVREKPANEEPKQPPQKGTVQKLPTILPKLNFIDKKGPENTIVVLPAAPYIFPQRPILFPSVPPAIVLVDSNLQPFNKTAVPVMGRSNGDITKTTMVNILPISAYSRPMSATKNKKTNSKLKTDVVKKTGKKTKPPINIIKDAKNNSVPKDKVEVNAEGNNNTNSPEGSIKKGDKTDSKPAEITGDKVSAIIAPKEDSKQTASTLKDFKDTEANNLSDNISTKQKENEVPIVVDEPVTVTVNKELPPTTTPSSAIEKNAGINRNSNESSKCNKILNREAVTENKDKDNKLSNILESTLRDTVELAEEFLATSPTAAFLMSFPLVSGNRADSPAEEPPTTTQSNTKDSQRRNDLVPPPVPFFEKPNSNELKVKLPNKTTPCNVVIKQTDQQKFVENIVTKEPTTLMTTNTITKTCSSVTLPNVPHENPFLNLSMPSLITTNCTLADTAFTVDFDCSIAKSMPTQSSSYVSSNNFFYKGEPFGTVKSTIYSTSSISSSHEFNGLGLYPCAMEKYASKNKPEYAVDENLMKMGSSRLTYDIDLGWSHKGFDFVNCTTAPNTFVKDSIITTTSSAPYTSSYNPFNPDFHIPLVSSSSKKDISNKTSSFTDTITSFYSQPTNLWSEDAPFYTNSNMSKNINTKNQNYPMPEPAHANLKLTNTDKPYDTKVAGPSIGSNIKPTNNATGPQISDKYTKKSPSKMHINWMTSEIRPTQNNCNPIVHSEIKETHKPTYSQLDHSSKKQDQNESNYFPISMHNFPAQTAQDEFQVWPSARPLGTTEISIEPPPINLPTLVGDLALGPHDKKKSGDMTNRVLPQGDIQNCGNFLSVTQLMNRSSDNMSSRYHVPNIDAPKSMPTKQNTNHFSSESNRKTMTSHLENHIQPCYVFNDPKGTNPYDNLNQFSHTKAKSNSKPEKTSKSQKNNYSTEALLRGANYSHKVQDNSGAKFMMPTQKYDYNSTQDSSVAQVSHFPPILDYPDNSYASQQYSGTTLYNATTNTISNSFYSNFMPGSSNLMSSNYASGPFPGDYIDYNQSECNYTNHKYDELKMRNNSSVFQAEKVPSNYKSSRRESAAKHKLECSKKESSKKYQSKKAKITAEVEEWNDPSHLLWQNKGSNKKHSNLMSEELPFPNYVGNQMSSQYQADFFNSHLMPTNMQGMGHNVDRSLASFPVTSRANFNLSTIFPEITMKVQ